MTVAVAAVAAGALPAAADIPTTVTAQYDQNTLAFDGMVSSSNSHCLAGRHVTITRYEGETPTTIGTATSDKTGAWSYPDASAQAGTYEVTVDASKVKGPKRKHKKRKVFNCAAGTTGRTDL